MDLLKTALEEHDFNCQTNVNIKSVWARLRPPIGWVTNNGYVKEERDSKSRRYNAYLKIAASLPGSLLVVPAGVRKMPDRPQSPVNVAYVYAKGHWSAPLLQLPVTSKVHTYKTHILHLETSPSQSSALSTNSTEPYSKLMFVPLLQP